MAPLAGRPPFATDEPDSFYESSPQPARRLRQQPPPDPNKRSSAYDMYDNYLGENQPNPGARPQSGADALGMGMLNGALDDDDDDDEEDYPNPHRKPAPSPPMTPTSKHAALAAATGANGRKNTITPPPQYIASPRPGYAAPITALNLARPEKTAVPQGRQPQEKLENPFEPPSPMQQHHFVASSPSPMSATPHPLQPPMTPITPVFARPAKSPAITFSGATPRVAKPIIRGNSEETLLPKRGEKGDDFWRRFSMVAKEENKKPWEQKESPWLKKTQNGTTKLARWVWITGIVLLLCIAAAIGLGWYFTHNKPSHQQPTVFGGSANELATATSSVVAQTADKSSTSPHVSPTRTVARRAVDPMVTPVIQEGAREALKSTRVEMPAAHKRKRLEWH